MLWEVEGKVRTVILLQFNKFNFFWCIRKRSLAFVSNNLKLFNAKYFGLFPQWVVKGAVDVDIGANPSAEGGEEDEGVDDQAERVVDIQDTFRLQVCKVFF